MAKTTVRIRIKTVIWKKTRRDSSAGGSDDDVMLGAVTIGMMMT